MRITHEVTWSWVLVDPAKNDGKFKHNKIVHTTES